MSYAKGRRREEELVRLLTAQGWSARRIPLSGQAGQPDVILTVGGREIGFSVKTGRRFPKRVYDLVGARVGDHVVLSLPQLLLALDGRRDWPSCEGRLPACVERELRRGLAFAGKRPYRPWLFVIPVSWLEGDRGAVGAD